MSCLLSSNFNISNNIYAVKSEISRFPSYICFSVLICLPLHIEIKNEKTKLFLSYSALDILFKGIKKNKHIAKYKKSIYSIKVKEKASLKKLKNEGKKGAL